MTEAIARPVHPPTAGRDRPVQRVTARPVASDQDGQALLLVPTIICLVMFVVTFWW